MLLVEDLTAGYGPVDVLRGISLHVAHGEIVAVVGPNGAGKSTLLKTLVGLVEPRRGTVYFAGKTIKGLPPERILARGLALVPEGRGIFAGLSVLENLKVGAYLEGDQQQIEKRLDYIYGRFPVLSRRKLQSAITLSGGEQQQLAIARALMSGPQMLMLDEPSLGLAPNLVHSVMELLTELRQEGLTVLLVEQNIQQALAVSDRVYVMASGAVQLEGRSRELRERGLELEKTYLGGTA